MVSTRAAKQVQVQRLTAEELLLYADRLAARVRADAQAAGLCAEDALAAQVIALTLSEAVYPEPRALFSVLLEAEGVLDLALGCDGDPC